MMSVIGYLVFRGTKTIERFFAGWSFVLYAVFVLFFVLCFVAFGPEIQAGFKAVPIGAGWAVGGVRYAAYNLAIIPGLLFCVRHIETRREAISAGLLASPIAIIPGFLFYLAMAGSTRRSWTVPSPRMPAGAAWIAVVPARLPGRAVRYVDRDGDGDDPRGQ